MKWAVKIAQIAEIVGGNLFLRRNQMASLGITQSLLAHRESSKRARFAVTGRLIFTKMTETRIEKRLKSIACICLERKQKGKPFCRKCFTKLPDDLKQRLSNQLVEDFLVAYDGAKSALKPN